MSNVNWFKKLTIAVHELLVRPKYTNTCADLFFNHRLRVFREAYSSLFKAWKLKANNLSKEIIFLILEQLEH